MPSTNALTPESILDVTAEAIRRFGYDRTSVGDVGRLLGVSHGAIYRRFRSKKALFEAAVLRWLKTIHAPLQEITEAQQSGNVRLAAWLRELVTIPLSASKEAPELFLAYGAMAVEGAGSPDARIEVHWEDLRCQLALILAQGREEGTLGFNGSSVEKASSFLDAMASFYRPELVEFWQSAAARRRGKALEQLLLASLKPVSETAHAPNRSYHCLQSTRP